MALLKYNPFWEMDIVTREMDKLFKNVYSENEKKELPRRDFVPRVDISEDKQSIELDFELPGIEKNDVKISINDQNVLLVKGEKKFPSSSAKTCCRNERSYGTFFRSFQLPEMVNHEKIEASFNNGVLTVKISKMEPVQAEAKEIEVQ